MRDDVGIRSQEFVEDGPERRRDQYSAQRQQAWRSLPDATVGRFQQTQAMAQQVQQRQQQHDREMMQSAQELAMGEIRRKTAMEELQWAQQLHGADMLEIQKKSAAATLRLQEAQVEKALKAMGDENLDKFSKLADLSEPEMAYMRSELGMDATIRGGKIEIGEVAPEKRAQARAKLEGYEKQRSEMHEAQVQALKNRGLRQPETAQQTMRDYTRLLEKTQGVESIMWTPEHRQQVETLMQVYRDKLAADGIDLQALDAATAAKKAEQAPEQAADDEPMWNSLYEELLKESGK